MRRTAFAASLILAAATLPASASAQNPSCTSLGATNLVKNCSFEAPDVPTGTQKWQFTQSITGWKSSTTWFERWYGHDSFASRQGGAHLELDVDASRSGRNTTIWQVLDTEAGRKYNVFFSAAHRHLNSTSVSKVGAFIDVTGAETQAMWTTAAFTTPEITNADKYEWFDYGFSFTATGSKTTLAFRALGTENQYGDHLDNIGVTAVPEPSTFALVSFGLVGLGAAARRRRRA